MNRCRRTFSPHGLVSLFALALTLSVICGSYLPGYPQALPLPPREDLEERIRDDVARHLEIRNAPLDHPSIKELYFEAAQAAGLSYPELIDLYETEYSTQKAADKPSPWEKFRPNIGWLVGFFSLSVLAYVTVLKKWLEARFQAVGNWVYRQLSGTRLCRNVALRKYRAALVQNYEHLPMPFLKNRDPLKMSEVYVPLKVSDIQEDSRWGASTGVAAKAEPLDALGAIATHRRLMVIGEPGSGKSVLLKSLAWAYGLGQLDTLSDRPTVVLLELYRLSNADLDEAKLIQALVDTFDRNQFPNAQTLVRQSLEAGTLMLLLDGLDEVNSEVRPHVVGVIRDLLKKHSQCRVVMTCRTAVYDGEFSDIADRKLEVVDFTDQQMRRFLKAWEPEMQQAGKSINQMMAALRERPLILKLARNPLLLTLIAYLYTEPAFVLPRSRAEFYDKSTGILLEQREYKGDDDYKHNRYEPNEKRRVLQHLALYTQDHSAELQDRRSLKAAVVREQVKQVLPSLDIPEKEAKDILDEIAERSGLFMKIDGGERYLFPHLTIQEYFAAVSLTDQESELFRRFETDSAAWREVIKLWCSLANDSTTLVNAVYQKDPVTGFECLAEARNIDQGLASHIIDQFKQNLYQPQADETLTRAFGSVAANERLRGQAVFAFLKETLITPRTSDTLWSYEAIALSRTNAAIALSNTNLPKAATVLIAWYKDSQSIVSMGDLVVPGLVDLAQKGILKALDDLYAIATPDAAAALVPLLWHEQTTVMSRAAWYLGGLLPQLDIEETLREYPLTLQQLKAESLGWIWQPFNESSTSALPTIAGRIAHLLQDSPLQLVPEVPPNLDPRLVVPLCTFLLKPDRLPHSLPESAEALLEQTEQTPQLEQACLQATHQLLAKQPEVDQQWKQLIATLPPRVELDFLSRLITYHQPNRNHWSSLFEVVDYNLKSSWHYSGVLLISSGLSAIAIMQMAAIAITQPENILIMNLLSSISIITLTFWITIWYGVEETLEPSFFWEIGPLGLTTFLRQITQILHKNPIWPGMTALYQTLTERNYFSNSPISALSIIGGAAMVMISGLVAVFGKVIIIIIIAFAATGATAVTSAVAVTVNSAITGVMVFATLCVIIGALIGNIAVIAVAVATGVCLGVTLASWHQLKSTPEKKWLKILSLFAFPWFCWLPIVTTLSTWALYDLLSQVSSLSSIPIWQQTAVVVAAVTGLWAALWRRGQWLDARARNPFHGGALGAALGVKRSPSAKGTGAFAGARDLVFSPRHPSPDQASLRQR